MHLTPPLSKSPSSWDILSQAIPSPSRTFFPLLSMFSVQGPMFLPLFLIFLLTPLHAQSPDPQVDFQLQSKPHLDHLPNGEKTFKWTGLAGRTYFLQSTANLRTWNWLPVIQSGVAAPMAHPIAGSAADRFFRIASTSQTPPPGLSLENWDADGDRISNWAELTTHGSNPLLADTDADGLPDDWEIAHSLNVTDNGTLDPQHGPNAFFNTNSPTGDTTIFQAFNAGVQANAAATIADLDGDVIPNAQDADPRSAVINWHKSTKPAYIAMPIPGWNLELHSYTRRINNHNDVLTPTALFRNGQWSIFNSSTISEVHRPSPPILMPYSYLSSLGLHTTTLIGSGVTSISDTGDVMGWIRLEQKRLVVIDPVTGETIGSGGFMPYFPAIWRNPQSLPEIYGYPPGSVLDRPWRTGWGSMARDGTVVTVYSRESGFLSDAPSIYRYPTPANGGGMQNSLTQSGFGASVIGQGGHVAYSTSTGNTVDQSWIWPANGSPKTLIAVTTSAAGGAPLNFQTDPKMIGKAPGGASCINLDGQVLIERAGRYYQVPSLQETNKISEHGTAIKSGTSFNPTIWHGGSSYPIRDCIINQDAIGSSLYVGDMNDKGSILGHVDANTPTSHPVILVPFELKVFKRGTFNTPGAEVPAGKGEFGYETVMMENADSETNAVSTNRDCDAPPATADLSSYRKEHDDDLVKIVLKWPAGFKPAGASLKLLSNNMLVNVKQTTPDAAVTTNGPSRMNFYRADGTRITNPTTDLQIADLANAPTSSYLSKILTDGELTLFIEGADHFGDLPELDTDRLGGALVRWEFTQGAKTTAVKLLVYRGGFLRFLQPSNAPGTIGTFEFWDGKGRVRHAFGGFGNEFKTDETDYGTLLASWTAKSGKTANNPVTPGKGYAVKDGFGHTPPGWWSTERRTDFTGKQPDQKSGTGANRKIRQGGYVRWLQDDEAAAARYTTRYRYDASDAHDASLGEPTSLKFKYDLETIPPSEAQGRTDIQIHPDGECLDPIMEGTAGCIGIQTYQDCKQVEGILQRFHGLRVKVQLK